MSKFVKLATVAALSLSVCAFAEKANLLESGSFEWPPVRKRKSIAEGADVSKSAMNAEWYTFKDSVSAEGGSLVLGLTNEVFRTGRQCIFVNFDKLTRPLAVAQLASDFVSVKPEESYRVSIWGRIDKENPLALDQRVPNLKLRVDWFLADKEEQVGNAEYRIQPIPGSRNRVAMFSANKWSEYFANLKSPEGAAFMRVTWTWETPAQAGETHGTAYFDDATIFGEPGPKEDLFADEPAEKVEPEKPAEPEVAKAPEPAKPEKPKDNLLIPLSTPVPPPATPQKPKAAK